jgi:hypothetical protein
MRGKNSQRTGEILAKNRGMYSTSLRQRASADVLFAIRTVAELSMQDNKYSSAHCVANISLFTEIRQYLWCGVTLRICAG